MRNTILQYVVISLICVREKLIYLKVDRFKLFVPALCLPETAKGGAITAELC